jgi:hypothetical protein
MLKSTDGMARAEALPYLRVCASACVRREATMPEKNEGDGKASTIAFSLFQKLLILKRSF